MITIERITQTSPFLKEVKALGKANAATLGFLPEGAFDEHAKKQNIIVAVERSEVSNLSYTEKCIGYLLFRIRSEDQTVRITHLCIDQTARGKRISKKLVEFLRDITNLQRGIGLWCRKDYAANNIWPRLNFVPYKDKPGRNNEGKLLTYWWYDYGKPDLFSLLENSSDINSAISKSKLNVFIDANIFFDLHDNSRPHEESRALLADWLEDSIQICVTDEILVEISHSKDENLKNRSRQLLQHYKTLPSPVPLRDQVYKEIEIFFPLPSVRNQNDESDLKQLAKTIAAGGKFFVTRDVEQIKRADQLYDMYGLWILRPSELIIHLDQLRRESEYQPARLAGTLVSIELISKGQEEKIASVFHEPSKGEAKKDFLLHLRTMLAKPQQYSCYVAKDASNDLLALLVYDNTIEHELRVPLFRVKNTSLAPSISRYVIHLATRTAGERNNRIIVFSDEKISDIIKDALKSENFFDNQTNQEWIKLTISGVYKSDDLTTLLINLSNQYKYSFFADHIKSLQIISTNFTTSTHPAITQLSQVLLTNRTLVHSSIETLFWPVKIADGDVPTFIVPIRPKWAQHLFDEKLANQTLLGARTELALQREAVYYRRRKNDNGLIAPGRILWYVSADKYYQGITSIRACSKLDEVVVDKAKTLFRQFRRFGIYEWKHVFELADNSHNCDIMALRFSNTELFDNPVPLKDIQKIIGNHTTFPSPLRISREVFTELYKLGYSQALQ
jgi:predicted nucleic acid-binding protein